MKLRNKTSSGNECNELYNPSNYMYKHWSWDFEILFLIIRPYDKLTKVISITYAGESAK